MIQRPAPVIPPDCPLTQTQFEIMLRVTQGATYKQVAYERDVRDSTIRTHVGLALARLGVSESRQAVVLFMNKGWHADEDMPEWAVAKKKSPPPDQTRSLPIFALAYLAALDLHLKHGDNAYHALMLEIAAEGLTGIRMERSPATRESFLDLVLEGIRGGGAGSGKGKARKSAGLRVNGKPVYQEA